MKLQKEIQPGLLGSNSETASIVNIWQKETSQASAVPQGKKASSLLSACYEKEVTVEKSNRKTAETGKLDL